MDATRARTVAIAPPAALFTRFWRRCTRPQDGCWEWQGSTSNGYGSIVHRQQFYSAHRMACWLAFGPIPDGKLVIHKCDNKKCVRPSHLEIGDHSENLNQAWQRGRRL